MSAWLVKALLVAYCVITGTAIFEGNWKLAVYGAGAALVQVAVIAWEVQ